MNFKQIATLSILGLAVSSAYADFQWQADLGLQTATTEFDDTNDADRDTTTIALEGRYYLDAVKTEGKPVREAAFMGRNSFVRAGLSQTDIEQKNVKDDSADNTFVRGDIHIGDTDFRVGSEFATYNEDNAGVSLTQVSAFFGWYPVEQGLLTFEIELASGDDDANSDHSKTALIGSYKQLIPLGETLLSVGGGIESGEYEVDPDGAKAKKDDYVSLQVFAKWYPMPQFGFGARIESTGIDYDYDPVEARGEAGFYVNASYDFNELVGVSAELGSTGATNDNVVGKDTDESGASVNVAVQMRF